MRFVSARVLIIVVMGIVAAGFTVALTTSTLLRRGNPALAARMMPIDSVALANRAEQLLATDSLQRAPQVAQLARSALRLQALNPTALNVLGFLSTARGDQQAGRALIAEAQKQSRRNASVQVWLIEDAVQRGDLRQALFQYDVVLRTKPSQHEMMFPILLSSLGEPKIRAELGRYYSTDIIWVPQFAAYALANSKDLNSLVALELETGGMKNPKLAHDQRVGLIRRLVLENGFPAARRVYLAMPGATTRKLTDVGFDDEDIDGRYGAIGWQTRTQPDASSALTKNEADRPSLLLSASPLTSANIATKLLYLQPGRYRINMQITQFEGGDGAAVGLQVRCPVLRGDQPVWSARARGSAVGGDLVLPAGCSVQYLDIMAIGGSGESELAATVRSATLRPL